MPNGARRLAVAWVLLVISVAIHVADEALTGFLGVYNPTVAEIRRRVVWLRPPIFTFDVWLTGLVIAIVIALLLTPLVMRFRAIAIVVAVLMLLNGCSHITGTILGHTFNDIRFARPMPGTYSSPLLIAASIYVLVACKNRQP